MKLLLLLFVMTTLVVATASCAAAFSGYDQSKYASSNSGDASSSMTTPVDPETEPLPRMKATKMLDPRSPLGDAGSEAR